MSTECMEIQWVPSNSLYFPRYSRFKIYRKHAPFSGSAPFKSRNVVISPSVKQSRKEANILDFLLFVCRVFTSIYYTYFQCNYKLRKRLITKMRQFLTTHSLGKLKVHTANNAKINRHFWVIEYKLPEF